MQVPSTQYDLPSVRGHYVFAKSLAELTWFRVGGAAEVIFTPADKADLQAFLRQRDRDLPLTVLGAGSNTLARDGGVCGVTIRLGRAFGSIELRGADLVYAGAGALDVSVARFCASNSLSGLEFFRGIPGSIGGAIAMNAGAYGSETRDRLVSVEAMTWEGEIVELTPEALEMSYRHVARAEEFIFLGASFHVELGVRELIESRMEEISAQRESSQPIKSRTGGSTFKNPGGASPDGPKAWKLIDAAGCRGLSKGGAQVSPQHCNFLINHGAATAQDIEELGETVRQRVLEESGIELSWEIKRVGVAS